MVPLKPTMALSRPIPALSETHVSTEPPEETSTPMASPSSGSVSVSGAYVACKGTGDHCCEYVSPEVSSLPLVLWTETLAPA